MTYCSYSQLNPVNKSPVNASTDISQDSNIRHLKRILLSDESSSFLRFDVTEVREPWETCEPLSDDFGGIFNYCGDLVGGIKNLLQTDLWTTPHIRFENQPIENKKIYFYGFGDFMKATKSLDTSKCYSAPHYVDIRAMILKTLQYRYNFDVRLTEDSLTTISFKVNDYKKLYAHQITYEEYQNMPLLQTITATHPDYQVYRNNILFVVNEIGKKWNLYIYDDTNVKFADFFHLEIPKDILETPDKIYELTNYLEENYGLSLSKVKKMKQVYIIKFNNQ